MSTNQVNAVDLRGGSKLERGFALRWATIPGAPALQREVTVTTARRWRFDFANVDARVGLELDGGLWRGTKGAHGGAGAHRDREKDFEALMGGWTVIRLTPDMARDRQTLQRIANFIRVRLQP